MKYIKDIISELQKCNVECELDIKVYIGGDCYRPDLIELQTFGKPELRLYIEEENEAFAPSNHPDSRAVAVIVRNARIANPSPSTPS